MSVFPPDVPPEDDDLRRLVVDAVDAREPADRLAEIRARTAQSTAGRRRARLAVGATVLAAAAAVVVVAVVAAPDEPQRVASAPTSTAADPAPSSVRGSDDAATTPVYYVGRGGDGPDAAPEVLYRYFEPEGDPLELLMSTPSDPDYRTLWPAGSLVVASDPEAGLTSVRLAEPSLTERPQGMSASEARLAVQQVVYTLSASYREDLTVRFVVGDGGGMSPVLGLPATEYRPGGLDVLSHVSISDPGEGFVYDDDFTARGVASGFEGTVACRLEDAAGAVVWEEPTVAASPSPQRLGRWSLRVDLDGLRPGSHTFSCTTDAGSSTEGLGSFTDTRTITVA